MTDTGYNGYRNRQTWNVALWIGNDERLYRIMQDYVAATPRPSWRGFVDWAGLDGQRTPDGFSFTGTRLDRARLSEMLRDERRDYVESAR